MNEKYEHTDLFGREIKVGDYFVYSAADGRSATIRVGQVLELRFGTPRRSDGRAAAKIYVKSWSNFRGRQKNVTLGFLTRVVVVPKESVSDEILSALAQ
jgi:hypothetical protein